MLWVDIGRDMVSEGEMDRVSFSERQFWDSRIDKFSNLDIFSERCFEMYD